METDANTLLFTSPSKDFTLPENVAVNLNPSNNRQKEHDLESAIEETWAERIATQPTMFNGTKFRLESIEEDDDSQTVTLNLGITCYKDFQGTNLSDNALILQSQGLCDHDNSQAFMSDALGVGALVLTSDDHTVLLFRSKNCGEDRNLWDRPGGHPEPKELVGDAPMDEINMHTIENDKVIAELFNSITQEVVSEVNIPADALEPPRIIGMHRSNLNGGKPNVEFLVRCRLTAEEVEELYNKGDHAEAYESEKIMLLPLDKALNVQANDKSMWRRMAAGAKGLFTMYNMHKHRFS